MDNSLNNLELAYKKLNDLETALIVETKREIIFELKYKINELKQLIANLGGNPNLTGLKEKVDISRLPEPSTDLVGRTEELNQLNQALMDKEKYLVHLWATGGIGKSALIFKWLQDMKPDYFNVQKIFAWSFYLQGSTNDSQSSSFDFFRGALAFLGFQGDMPKDDTERGRLLAKYLRNQSVILILDGLEPLQHRVNILDGELKDKALQALIDEVNLYGLLEKSLILISSRQELVELKRWNKTNYLQKELNVLSEEQGASLLETLGVIGFEEELKEATKKLGGHALSLILLGKLLTTKFKGDIQRRDRLPKLWEEKELGNHTKRILDFYAKLWKKKWWQFWKTEESPEQTFLYLLGLFDRPMGLLEKEHLIKNADIAKSLKKFDENQWVELEQKLEKAGLLLRIQDWESSKDCQSFAVSRMEWDCHPLIREFVGEQFKKQHFNLFQQAHLKLFEFYQQLPNKKYPETPEEFAPLYRAVVHGCLAGEYQKALYEVYVERILRGTNEHYSLHKLGLYSEDLSALAAFFPQGWSQPVQQGLSEAEQTWLLAQVSACLMSLGRLAEAIQPRQADLKISLKINDWKGVSITAQNLVDLMLPLGQLNEAVTAAKQAIDYAQQSEDLFMQMGSQAYLATALHRVGKLEESKNSFEQAEQLLKQWNSNYPQLFSLPGFSYCALLLDQATNQNDIEMVLKRGEYGLNTKTTSLLLDFALNSLTLARAYFKLDELKEAESYFNQAVDGIRKAGRTNDLPMFLLDRANFLIKINKLEEAKRDLEEAKQLISRSGMKLYEVDYHLAMCRFFYLTKEKRSFDKHLSAAKTLIKSTGYHLRDKSVSELENLTF